MKKTEFRWVRVVHVFCDHCGKLIEGSHTIVTPKEEGSPPLEFHTDYNEDESYTCYQDWHVGLWAKRIAEREEIAADELLVVKDKDFDPNQKRPLFDKIRLSHFIIEDTASSKFANIVYINSDCRVKWLKKKGEVQPPVPVKKKRQKSEASVSQ